MTFNYKEIKPGKILERYVKCYYVYDSDTDLPFTDKAFATGCIEIMFNLGTGMWQTEVDGNFTTTPLIELWGQIIKPLTFRTSGNNSMFGIRLFPHTASCFLDENIEQFNNRVSDIKDVMNSSAGLLYERLLETESLDQRVIIVEDFLLHRLSLSDKKLNRIHLIGHIINELKQEDFFDNMEQVASRYGITSRYLQKLFLQYTGLTPKLFSKINRFQNSLVLISKQKDSLTSVAYECGYFDQSHFIREFKSFTGSTPSGFNSLNSSAILASPNK
jgi:AraC-like DNA-binding protein